MGIPKHTEFAGKTVAFIATHPYEPYAAVKFTDGTHAVIEASYAHDCHETALVNEYAVENRILRDMGLIDAAEFDRRNAVEDEARKRQNEQHERAMLARLQAKYAGQ
jgi:hypothetical protein